VVVSVAHAWFWVLGGMVGAPGEGSAAADPKGSTGGSGASRGQVQYKVARCQEREKERAVGARGQVGTHTLVVGVATETVGVYTGVVPAVVS